MRELLVKWNLFSKKTWIRYASRMNEKKVKLISGESIHDMPLHLAAVCPHNFIIKLSEKQFPFWTQDQLRTWRKPQLQGITKDQFATLDDVQINTFTRNQVELFTKAQHAYFFPYVAWALNLRTLFKVYSIRMAHYAREHDTARLYNASLEDPLDCKFLGHIEWPHLSKNESIADLVALKIAGKESAQTICDRFFGERLSEWRKQFFIIDSRSPEFTDPSSTKESFNEEITYMNDAAELKKMEARQSAYMRLVMSSKNDLTKTYYLGSNAVYNCFELMVKITAAHMYTHGFDKDGVYQAFHENNIGIFWEPDNKKDAVVQLDSLRLANIQILEIKDTPKN